MKLCRMNGIGGTRTVRRIKTSLGPHTEPQEQQQHRSHQQHTVQRRRVEKGKEKQEEEGKEMGKEDKKAKGKGEEERQDGKEGRERGGVEQPTTHTPHLLPEV